MASAVNRFGVQLVRQSFRTRPVLAYRQLSRPAPFHRSAYLRDDDESESKTKKAGLIPSSSSSSSTSGNITSSSTDAAAAAAATTGSTAAADDAEPAEYIDYGEVSESAAAAEGFMRFQPGMTRDEQSQEVAKWQDIIDNPPEELREWAEKYQRDMSRLEAELNGKVGPEDIEDTFEVPDNFMEPTFQAGLFAEGEDDLDEAGDDEDFEGDDITSLAHGDLEQHREMRHYARIAAWELPLLSKYAKKFEPPGKDRPLRFRYTSYMGEEHPAEKKVVLEFCTADLPLTPEQRLKLVKLVGPRYDPQRDVVHMSCESHATAAQNKRYLGDLVDTLLTEARNESAAEGGKDAFADMPPDFRHVRWKKRYAFPAAWKLDTQRKVALARERSARISAEERRLLDGTVVDGNALVEQALRNTAAHDYATVGGFREGKPAPRLR